MFLFGGACLCRRHSGYQRILAGFHSRVVSSSPTLYIEGELSVSGDDNYFRDITAGYDFILEGS